MENIDALLKKIIDEKYGFGTGVWTVVNPNILMEFNEFGEYIPVIKNKEIAFSDEDIQKLKETNITFSNKNESDIAKELFSEIPRINYNQKIGFYSNLYAGHVSEGEYRKNASSGGCGTWILKELIEKKHVDYIIHVKESESSEKLFEYGISTTLEEVVAGAKTKYYPVEMSKVLQFVINNPGKYALIGLPSFITEIRLLSQINSVIKERICFTIGLICGHQKSSLFGEFLAWQCGITPGNLKNINFRKKTDDEPASSYAIEVTGLIDDKEVTITKKMKDLFGGDWGKGLFKLRASDFTDDVMNETADITLGDAWLPEYTQDSKGNNVIIVRNPIIDRIIQEGIEKGNLNLDKISEEKIIQSQAAHYRHTQEELSYRIDKKDKKNQWRPQLRVQSNKEITFIRKKIQDKRELICIQAPREYLKAVKKDDINYFINYMKPVFFLYDNLYRLENGKKKILKFIKKIIKIY